jgi:hypothetical protein
MGDMSDRLLPSPVQEEDLLIEVVTKILRDLLEERERWRERERQERKNES